MLSDVTTSDFIPAPRPSPPPTGPALLQVHTGCAVHPLDRPRVRIGRQQGLEIGLEDSACSKLHAELVRDPAGWTVHDLESRNGTFVDGVPVRSSVPLRDGQLLRVGRTLLLACEAWPRGQVTTEPFHGLVGPFGLGAAIEELRRAAQRGLSLLILGPSGSGKEVAARAYHAEARPSGPFVAVNVAALPDDLFEAELFGVVPGAFTGARSREGAFRAAEGGVLFLDEVGSLPPRHYSTLQRALQEGEVRPVGSDRVVLVDVLVVAATDRPLSDWVREGRFEASLYNRLRQALVELPPLHERRADIPALTSALLARAHGAATGTHSREALSLDTLGVEALELLLLEPWPHHVRQLRHVLAAAAGAGHAVPTLAELDRALEGWRASALELDEEPEVARKVREALARAGGNKAAAARALGIDRSTLYRRLRRDGS